LPYVFLVYTIYSGWSMSNLQYTVVKLYIPLQQKFIKYFQGREEKQFSYNF